MKKKEFVLEIVKMLERKGVDMESFKINILSLQDDSIVLDKAIHIIIDFIKSSKYVNLNENLIKAVNYLKDIKKQENLDDIKDQEDLDNLEKLLNL